MTSKKYFFMVQSQVAGGRFSTVARGKLLLRL
jgi:hypothetical protein